MPGETAGVEYRPLDTEGVFVTITRHIIQTDFEKVLLPAPFEDLDDWLIDIETGAIEDEVSGGAFVIRLSLTGSPVQGVKPEVADWITVHYGFYFNEEGEFKYEAEKMVAGDEDFDPIERFELPKDTRIYELENRDIDWINGYQLMLGPDPANHYLLTREQ
jgi:hypothetical protein